MKNWLLSFLSKFTSQGFGRLPNFAAKAPTWSSLRYRDYVKEGYQSLIWVYRCVREIAEAISIVPWKVFRVADDGTRIPVTDHPLERLLKRPNDIMSGPAFFESWAIFFLLSGNSFVEIVRAGADNNVGPPLELFPLRPDYMKVVPDPDTYISGYILDVQGVKVPYRPDEVIHWKLMNPLNDHIGMSPMMAGARIVDTENSAIGWNKVMLENAAQPSGALVVPEGKLLSPLQRVGLKQQLENKFSRANAHRPMLLENGIKWEQMSISQRDMEFSTLRKMSALEICALFGVPPEVIGAGDRPKFENYEIARLSFWEETVINLLEKLKAGINMHVAPLFGDNIEVGYDLTNVPAMRSVFAAKIDNAGKLAELGYSLNQINARLELGFEDVPWGDMPLVPGQLVPIEDVLSGATLDTGKEPAKPAKEPKKMTPLELLIQTGKSAGHANPFLEGLQHGYQRVAGGAGENSVLNGNLISITGRVQ